MSHPRMCNWATIHNFRHGRIYHRRMSVAVDGDFRSVFDLAQGISYPQTIEDVAFTMGNCRAGNVLETLTPLAHDLMQRGGTHQVDLGISVQCLPNVISVQPSTIKNVAGQLQRRPFGSFTARSSRGAKLIMTTLSCAQISSRAFSFSMWCI